MVTLNFRISFYFLELCDVLAVLPLDKAADMGIVNNIDLLQMS